MEAFNYSDTSIDWDNNCAEMKARDRLVREGQDCFFKQFIELSTWSQEILALIPGNRRSLRGGKCNEPLTDEWLLVDRDNLCRKKHKQRQGQKMSKKIKS